MIKRGFLKSKVKGTLRLGLVFGFIIFSVFIFNRTETQAASTYSVEFSYFYVNVSGRPPQTWVWNVPPHQTITSSGACGSDVPTSTTYEIYATIQQNTTVKLDNVSSGCYTLRTAYYPVDPMSGQLLPDLTIQTWRLIIPDNINQRTTIQATHSQSSDDTNVMQNERLTAVVLAPTSSTPTPTPSPTPSLTSTPTSNPFAVTLQALPNSINVGQTTRLTATLNSSRSDNISYYFWWDCNSMIADPMLTGPNISCGDPHDPVNGAVFENLSPNSKTKTVQTPPYLGALDPFAHPKVMVKQGNSLSYGSYVTQNIWLRVIASSPALSALLTGGSGGVAPYSSRNTAYATSTNNTGNYNYYFYCDRPDSGTTTNNPTPFDVMLNQIYSYVTMSKACTYSSPGTYSSKVIINQGSLFAENRMNITVTAPPTVITPNLTLNPNPSDTTQQVTLTGTASTNNVVDTMNYSFWWNCASTATSYAQVVTDCGSPTQANIGAKFNNLSASTVSKSVQHVYSQTGAFKPKVIIEQGNASAGKSASLQVNAAPPAPTLYVDLNVSPAQSSPGDLVKLDVITSSNTASGNYSYYFWWNCNKPTSDDLNKMKQDCGDPALAFVGSVALNKSSSVTSFTRTHVYSIAGTFYPKALVVHQNITKTTSATLNVVKPTLTAGLTINPTAAEGSAKPATLTASAGGTATKSVNYTFWWNCSEAGANITDLTTKCGNPLDSSKGAKFTENSNQKIITYDYIQTGTFHPKVVVERGFADPAEARSQIVINEVPIPTLNVSLGAVRTSEDNKLPADVDITANISGSATGQTNYKIWWDCQPNPQDYSKLNSLCGDPTDVAKGTVVSSADGELSKTVTTSYALSGLRHPFVLAERQSIQAVAATEINIPPVVIPDTLTSSLTLTPSTIIRGESASLSAVTQSNNSTDTYNYYFWWDCPDTSSLVLNDVIAACGDPNDVNIGKKFIGLSNTATSQEVSREYNVVGLVHPRVFAEHGTVSTNSSSELVVNDSALLSVIPVRSPRPSPTVIISPNPCQSVQVIFYYSHTYIGGGGVTTLDGYKALIEGDDSPVFDIYLSTDGGSVYKRIDHDFDPMPGAVMSKLPTPIKSVALGSRNYTDDYLKITHNIQIPLGMISDPSKAKILVYAADNRHYFDPSNLPAGTTYIPSGGQDLGDSFIFNQGALYGTYAGPTDSGDVMDYSDTIKLSECPPPGPSPTPGVSATPTPSVTAVSSAAGCESTINSPTTWSINQNNQSSPTDIIWKSNFAATGQGQQASIYLTPKLNDGSTSSSTVAAVMIPDIGTYSYSSANSFSDASQVVLRLDQYEDGKLISSCNKTLAVTTSTTQCSGVGCLPKTLNSILILGSLLASIAAYLLTAVASMPFLYRAANSIFALFAPTAWPGKKPSWGIAYDAVSKHPLENVIVRIFSEPSGRLKSTIRSSVNGAFGFILPAGKYSVVASKAGFGFPSRLILGNTDGRFMGVYKGGSFDVAGDGLQKAQININIPLDRSSLATFDVFQVKALATISKFFQVIRMPIMILGTLSAGYLVITSHRTIDLIIGALYIVLWVIEIRNMIKKRSYGLVRDHQGNPISMVLVRAFDAKGQLKNTVVTGEDGKFQLSLDPGEYRLDASRSGYKSIRTQSFKIDKIQDIGRLNLVLEKLTGR